jgi:hypothetical protein
MLYFIQQYLSQFLRAIENAIAALHDAASGGGESPAQDPSIPPAGELIGSVDDGHGLLINVYGDQLDGAVQMTVKVVEGVADLRGFFMDVGDGVAGVDVEGVAQRDYAIADESVTSVGSRDNNMNGTGEQFDVGVEIGSAGIGKDDISQATFTLEGVSLEQLDGLTFGVRATSVGEDRDGGVKLLGEFDIPEPPADPETPPAEPPADPETPPAEPPVVPPVPVPSVDGNFPQLPDNITSIVLVYNTPSGDANGDGYYAAKVENVSWVVEDDLDLWLVDATNYLQANDPNIDANTQLLGVAITHSDGTSTPTGYYAMDGNPGEDTAPTTDLTPETTVEYDWIMS